MTFRTTNCSLSPAFVYLAMTHKHLIFNCTFSRWRRRWTRWETALVDQLLIMHENSKTTLIHSTVPFKEDKTRRETQTAALSPFPPLSSPTTTSSLCRTASAVKPSPKRTSPYSQIPPARSRHASPHHSSIVVDYPQAGEIQYAQTFGPAPAPEQAPSARVTRGVSRDLVIT